MREDSGDGEAAGAFDVHEKGARGGDEGLFVLFIVLNRSDGWMRRREGDGDGGKKTNLELMLAGFGSGGGI